MEFPNLARPINLGRVPLRNRLVAQCCVVNLANENGTVSPRLKDLYREKGRGGWGMVNVEASYIRQDGRNFTRMLGLYDDAFVACLNELAEAIQEGGAKASVQLMHGGRLANPGLTGTRPLSPSAGIRGGDGIAIGALVAGAATAPKEMSHDEIEEMIDSFVAAARRCKEAGFDAVMIHGAHGFMVMQFMSPRTNLRTDIWGDPATFVTRLIKRLRQAVGPDMAVGIRISADEMLGQSGLTLEESVRLAPLMEAAGLDYIDVSAAGVETGDWAIQPIYYPRGCLVHLAEGIKKAVKIPVVAVGRINDPILAEKIVEAGRADLVSLCRGALADPQFARKALSGHYNEIRKCIACDIGCTGRMIQQRGVMCAINYEIGRDRHEYELTPAAQPKRVLVVGGGVAGMEAARVAALRRHQVMLVERERQLGGNVSTVAAAIPRLYTRDLNNVVDYLVVQMELLGVRIEVGREATAQLVDELKPDVVIVATGARPSLPAIPGAQGRQVLTLDDYLKGNGAAGNRVVVIGGQHGCEVAVSLSREGKTVTVLEESNEIATSAYLYVVRRMVLEGYLRERQIAVHTGAKVREINAEGVRYVDAEGQERMAEADTVLLALERVPNGELAAALRGRVPELYEVGDCTDPKNIMTAMHSAYYVAKQI